MTSLLPVMPAHEIAERPEAERWLIEGLWSAEAVGVIGGEPKTCKSILGLSLAVAVASGSLALGRFAARQIGRVLLFAAEDALHIVRRRLDGIARAAGLALASLDIQVITVPALRLDVDADRERLARTVESLRPRLLLLDPFVRLHRIDENVAAEVAPVLAYLRELQRSFAVSVMLIHHSRKGAAKARAGQALRGSSEFHAWGDSNLYLRRSDDQLSLSIEHRAAASTTNLPVRLRGGEGDDAPLSLVVQSDAAARASGVLSTPVDKILRILADAQGPLPLDALRSACRMRTSVLCATLADLAEANRVIKTRAGYLPAPRPAGA